MSLNKFYRVILLAALQASTSSRAIANNITGPSSSESPYLMRTQPGVVTMSILTTGDSVNLKPDDVTPYRMVGIPDGLGAFDNGDGTFTLLMNHELSGNGINRAHGTNGSFVSKWIISKDDLTVLHGEDLMKHVFTWNCASNAYVPLANRLSRFCSADLPALSAFYNAASGLGYSGRIYMNGEESGVEGRCFAHLLDGNSYELPWLGKFSHENSVANPGTGDKTVVAGLDDTSPRGQVYIYVGNKTTSSDPIEAAGLKHGNLYGIKVTGFPQEIFATGIPSGTPFTVYNFGDVGCRTGASVDNESVTNAVTGFWRPEDGAWDPNNPKDFYFVTTASFTGQSRLWRLRFADPANPTVGGTIDMLLNGTEGQKMLDNITITPRGSIFLQEDVGEQAHIGKIWRYSIARGTLEQVAEHDPARFTQAGASFLTEDEESSGIIAVYDILGEGWLLCDVQAHYATDSELVEGGQLIAIHFPPGKEK